MTKRNLLIDALGFEMYRAYGYNEYLLNLLEYFYNNRHLLKFDNVILVCRNDQQINFDKYADRFQIDGRFFSNIIQRLLILNNINKRLSKQDVVLFTGGYSSIFKRSKNVLVIHDLLYLRPKLLQNFLVRLHRHISMPISIKNANVIIAISEFTKNGIIKNFNTSNDKIEVVYNYFNFEKFSEINNPGFVKNPFFLSVCTTAPHKNTITVLKAFAKYCEYSNQNDIVFVGSIGKNPNNPLVKYYNGLPKNIKERIHMTKNISNPVLCFLYSNCQSYITATLFEGLGMPIVEAMYFNKRVILSDIPVCREVSGQLGIYFNPESSDELFAKMIENPVVIEQINKEYALNAFSAENTSMKYINILNAL